MANHNRNLTGAFNEFLAAILDKFGLLGNMIIIGVKLVILALINVAFWLSAIMGILLIPTIFLYATKLIAVNNGDNPVPDNPVPDNPVPEPTIQKVSRVIGWFMGLVSSYFLINSYDNDFSAYKPQGGDYAEFLFVFDNEIDRAKFLFFLKCIYTFNALTFTASMVGQTVGTLSSECYAKCNTPTEGQQQQNSCLLNLYQRLKNNSYARVHNTAIELSEADGTRNEQNLTATVNSSGTVRNGIQLSFV